MLWALLAMLLAAPGAAQAETSLGAGSDTCDLALVGAQDREGFLEYRRELLDALARADAAALSLLVTFPLRVNAPDGAVIQLLNPRAVQARFEEFFPEELRARVASAPLEDTICVHGDIGIARGALWASRREHDGRERYRVRTVNLPSEPGAGPGQAPPLDYVCDAAKHRVVIDLPEPYRARYRSWNRPRPLNEPPDQELTGGTVDSIGTGVCRHERWTFTSGDTEYEVRRLGCEEDPPEQATGLLEVRVDGERRAGWWCY